MIRQLAHICLHTKKVHEMVSFYTDTLGLKVQFTLENEENITFGYYIACGNQTFMEIFDHVMANKKWGDGKVEDLICGNIYKHLCFQVDNIEEFVSASRKKGLQISDVRVGMDNSKQAWISDPDGNAIELMEYTEKSRQLQK
jgi:catechol 2,3-dioxygenase-like lactoylglutathione lyase family enzyme